MKKRSVARILCAVITAALLAGCGSSQEGSPAEGKEQAEEPAKETEETSGPAENKSTDFPSSTMTIICPYAAGGGSDLALRILAQTGEEQFGQTINVENVTGGSGSIGLVEMLGRDADGYTMGMSSVDLITLPLLGLAPAEVTRDAFKQICIVNGEAAAIIVPADSKYETMEEFVQAAVDNPGTIQLGNAGMGNIWHLAAIGIELDTGASFNHIPYDGAASAIVDALGGHVDAVICSIPEAAANITSGDLKVLGVAANERLESYPDVPTFKENGVDLTIMAVRGITARADTPPEVLEALQSGFDEAIHTDACRTLVEEAGMTYMPLNAEESDALLDEMSGSFEEIIAAYLETE
ncbi:MAG: tripartite tricarboxylate transporter substrate binding protein [Lachnospiraceae bacterium]|jgi:tripartite-type tricarboxylate transporter receptor subunit TctC|nr:tripartite tricarboxylate transporter substrate binding protein [Lachnospiraceae bacterium]MCI9382928.1 tripartite tricarboxylate transporter substrate binding protein [Lachnospiraceae bacterium]MCI9624774.1 tripartite tricarboxylate transporter substrate binding protein [Lachnospiraceae bacterium]